MTTHQAILLSLLLLVFAFLVWGRWRYDLVAFVALVVAVISGVVPADAAFSGFGHPATVIVALVLIVSRGLSASGAVELAARWIVDGSRRLAAHVGILSVLAAGLSAVMNNVAALALLMPLDVQAAAKAKRSPALSLMPLSFASILGGMVTLIGTPPNIVVAEFRGEALGASYRMFDFTPVGIACASTGILFIVLVGWRLIPSARTRQGPPSDLKIGDYVAEVEVPEGSDAVGQRVRDLDEIATENDTAIVGLIRGRRRLPGLARREEIAAGDILVLEANPAGIDKLIGALGLRYASRQAGDSDLAGDDSALLEAVVPPGARIEGRSARSFRLQSRRGVTLLGVSRQGKRFTERIRRLSVRAGDVLLLLGPGEQLPEIARWLGCLPLADRGLEVLQRGKAWLAIGIFGVAVALAGAGLVYLPIALAAAVALFVILRVVPLRQVYDSVEWPVVVLLGSMIPIGQAMETSGGTALIARQIVDASAGFSPVVVLTILIVVTMCLSDVMNNTATAVIAAPIAVDIARRLDVNPDTFLMGVAVAASCAFLTPIGHKNNTLIMGPGGYRFGDYWRMGLPLEVLIVLVSVPMLVWVWPL